MLRLEQVIKVLGRDIALKDFHLRFRLKAGVTHLAELNTGRSLLWCVSMNKYTIPIFNRTVHNKDRLDIPVKDLCDIIQQLVISDLNVDSDGIPHPDKELMKADNDDIEAAMLANLYTRLVERLK